MKRIKILSLILALALGSSLEASRGRMESEIQDTVDFFSGG